MNTILKNHRLRLALLLLLTLPATKMLRAQTASFNFSAGSATVTGWTNVTGDPSVSVISATDAATGISITSIATANWHPYDVSAYDGLGAANGTFFPAAVLLNHWFQYNGPVSVYDPTSPQLRVSGLNRYAQYTLRMAGSSTSGLNSNPTRYTVSGNTVYSYQDVNSHANTADGAVFNNVYPDSNGVINIYVNTLPTTDVGDISGLQVMLANPPLTFSDGLTRSGNNVVFGGTTGKVGAFKATSPNVFGSQGPSTSYSWAAPNMFMQATDSTPNPQDDEMHMYPEAFQVGLYSGSFSSPSTLHRLGFQMFCGNYQPDINMYVTDGTNSQSIAMNQYDIILPMFANTPALDSLLTTDHNGNLIFVPGVTHSGWGLTGNAGTNPASQYIGTTDAQPLTFRTNNLERFRIDASGNVGIGTVNPSSKLAVNGTITAQVVKVTPTGWSDYVFDSAYKLPALTEVDNYIKANKHLPDIASAGQVRQEGLDLGGNQAALLRKIEELTLYVIQQDKALKKANRRLSALGNEIAALKKVKKTRNK